MQFVDSHVAQITRLLLFNLRATFFLSLVSEEFSVGLSSWFNW